MKIITLWNSMTIELWAKCSGDRNDIWFYQQEQGKTLWNNWHLFVTKVKTRILPGTQIVRGKLRQKENMSNVTNNSNKNGRKNHMVTLSHHTIDNWKNLCPRSCVHSKEGSLYWRGLLWRNVSPLGNDRGLIRHKRCDT